MSAGVNHPTHHPTVGGDLLYKNKSVKLVVMDFIQGRTYLDNDIPVTGIDLTKIVDQAVKINRITYRPDYLSDSWAIPNIHVMYKSVQDFLSSEDKSLINQVLQKYRKIDVSKLPHSFVHGDIIKGNVIKADDGSIYIIDFSVANWYPRIQEIAVIASSLLGGYDDSISLQDRIDKIVAIYEKNTKLDDYEHSALHSYALAALAMELMGAIQEKHLKHSESPENDYWLELGREGLKRELA